MRVVKSVARFTIVNLKNPYQQSTRTKCNKQLKLQRTVKEFCNFVCDVTAISELLG